MSDIVVGTNSSFGAEAEIFRRISWGAIFSGVLVALSVELIFLFFGLFIGFQMTGGGAVAWTEAWYLVGIFFSLLIGGWIAARLAGNPGRGNGMLHGFVVWGLAMFTTAVLATALAWGVVKEASSLLQTAVNTTTTAQTTAQVPPAATPPPAVTQQNLTEDAATLADRVSSSSLVIFFGLLLAIAGALIGGAWAVPRQADFATRPHRDLPEPHPHGV